MKKVVLSMLDRAKAIDLLPKTGKLSEVKQVLGFVHELEMTKEEKEVEKSFDQIRDKKEKDQALNDWYKTPKDMEISDELYNKLHTELKNRDENSAVTVTDSMSLYDAFLGEDGE